MAKVTSKLQVTIPKALAEQYGIEPGDDIDWSASGDAIRLARRARKTPLDVRAPLEWFDKATERQRERDRTRRLEHPLHPEEGRGWTRDELYRRDKPR